MGKKKKTSLKQLTPVDLPHDGPLYKVYWQNQDETTTSPAEKLLQSAGAAAPLLSHHPRIVQLLTTLQQATKIQQQLESLHNFKSWWLHPSRETEIEDSSLAFLYRVFLEWMLSAQTPAALRRTLQSLLKTLSESSSVAIESIQRSVLYSLLIADLSSWSQPMQSLQEALHWEPLQESWARDAPLRQATVLYLADSAREIRPKLSTTTTGDDSDLDNVWDRTYLDQVQHALELAHVLKAVLRLSTDYEVDGAVWKQLKDFLWALLACRAVPADDLSTVAIAYGRVVGFVSNTKSSRLLDAHAWLEKATDQNLMELSELSRAVLWQGLAVTISFEQLMDVEQQADCLLQVFLTSFERLALGSPDPEVRLAALKGIRTLVSRCQNSDSTGTQASSESYLDLFSGVAHRTLDVILRSWEKPPTRKLASAIPSFFESLVQWMTKLEQNQDFAASLVDRLLAQPPNRKGRYLALEILLPLTGAREMLRGGGLLEELLSGIGDHGHNTKIIADLWAKLLEKLLQETLTVETSGSGEMIAGGSGLPTAWLRVWVPGLAQALLSTELSRRKRLSVFCLPRVVDIVGGVVTSASNVMSQAFASLLLELQDMSERLCILDEGYSRERETTLDRILWAKLEVVRISTNLACFRSMHVVSGFELRSAVRATLPMNQLCNALTHASASIRIAALQSMDKIVEIHGEHSVVHPLDLVKQESRLWKYMLPYSVKTEGSEYTASVLECLVSFLDRLMLLEASSAPGIAPRYLELTFSFIVDFLLGDFLVFMGYPGTAAAKETFLLSTLEYIALFVARDSARGMDCRLLPKILLQRRRGAVEVATMDRVLVELLGPEVFACLYTALNSIWDAQRDSAYRLCSSLLSLAHEASLPLFPDFTSGEARASMIERGVVLASSPRPREADTGSRLLAILCHSLPRYEEKVSYITFLVRLLEERLEAMKTQLASIMTDSVELSTCQDFPLLHGLLHSLRLVAEIDKAFSGEMESRVEALLHRMAGLIIQAIPVSLSIVADVRNGDAFDGLESDALFVDSDTLVRPKINPGALGANGIFSRLVSVSEEEVQRNQASQRLVIGTWLVTKETCDAIASILTIKGYRVDPLLVERTGTLLISTLTTVKHTGAAFAAHRALQLIAQRCQDRTESTLQYLPAKWVKRLVTEVAERDIVRNSTLRRSTGYALGFLSLMRSEVLGGVSRCPLCIRIMSTLVRLALPPRSQLRSFLAAIGLDNDSTLRNVVSCAGAWDCLNVVSDSDYELRCRIHALNILRLIVLDAPLSKIVFPFIGDAITCSIIGYSDPEWAVRNSSTMVFAAVMLRAVDADKNASNSGLTSRNATCVSEFFRSYPALPHFLLSVMRASLGDRLANDAFPLPPVLPILLLLARLQPVRQSGPDAVALSEPFVAVTTRCLEDKKISIRKAGARALTNLLSREEGSDTSFEKLAVVFKGRVTAFVQACEKISPRIDWNKWHGTLLVLHEMLKSSDEGKETVRCILTDTGLTAISLIEGRYPRMPPSCILALIGIFSGLNLPCALLNCYEVISWCEWLQSGETHVVGAGELAASAADVTTTLISAKIWKTCTSDALQPLLTELASIFQSSCADIRIAAVKRFKKEIYGGLDSVIERSTNQLEFVCKLLASLTDLLTKALSSEVHRGDDSSVGTIAHPPTLRRLSRCLLECLNTGDRLGLSAEILSGIQNNLEEITSTLCRRQLKDFIDPDSKPLLLGNIAEIQSYTAAGNGSTEQVRSEFVALLARISDPSCHWRLRHSAACALAPSRTLTSGGSNEASKGVRMLHLDRVGAWIKLVQDPDIDVRFAASKAWESDARTPEMALFRFFAAKACVPSQSNTEYSLEMALELSLGLKALEEENKSAKTIFKKENPNAYEERSLVFQCAMMAALSPCRDEFSKSCIALLDQIVCRCKEVLGTLLQGTQQCNGSSFLLNKTRMIEVFVPLHSLVLGCSLALHLSDHRDASSVQSLARKLLFVATDMQSQVHPIIRQALETLSHVGPDSEGAREIERSCFLTKALSRDPLSDREPHLMSRT